MNLKRFARLLSTGIFMFGFADIARADAGVPMLFLTLPGMLVALIPIIAVESIVVGRVLGTSVAPRIKSVAIANVVSTVVGIPLTWVALVVLQMVTGGSSAHGLASPTQKLLAVTWQAPWLIPYEGDLYWMVPTASLVLLVPFFITSYLIEAPIVARIESANRITQVRSAVFRANLCSYLFLALFNFGWLAWAVLHGPSRN